MKPNKLLVGSLLLFTLMGCGSPASSAPASSSNGTTSTQAPSSSATSSKTSTPSSVTPTPSSSQSSENKPATSEGLYAVATKHYEIGEAIAKTAFSVEQVSASGSRTKVTNFEVTLSEETASLTAKATITANGLTDTVAIPLKRVIIEAENCTNTTDNYRLHAKEGTYKIENSKGENGTASFGTNSNTRNSTTNKNISTEMTFTIESGCEQEISFFMNAASTNAVKGVGKMRDVIIEDAFDMKVNGEPTNFDTDAVLLGEDSKEWFNWKFLKIATLNLVKGTNTIDMVVNYQGSSLSGQTSGDGPMNIDYFVFQIGDEVPVTFNANGPDATIPDQMIKIGEKITKPADPKYSYTDKQGRTYNYVLENWYNGEKIWDFDKDVVKTNTNLKAKWTYEEGFFDIDPNAHVRAEGTTARIMSFNVLADDWNNKPAVNDTRANQGFNTIERYAPDVVGLQEFDDAWYTKAETLLDGYTVVNAENNKISGTTNYSALAYNTSTVKLIEWEQVRLSTSDNNYCRNVTTGLFEFITGESLGKRFIVTSTHWDLKEPQRVLQATEFAGMIKSLEEKYPNTPIMSCGDYNAYDSQSPITTFISESGMYDSKNAETKGIICNTSHLGNGMRIGDRVTTNADHWLRGPISFLATNVQKEECIDHIFATTNAKSLYATTIVDEDALNASDHCPIISDLQF